MKEKRVRTGRKPSTQAHDRERVQRAKLDRIPAGLWKEIRGDYPESVRKVGDRQAARGSLTLADVQALEAAEHEWLREMIETILAERHEEGAAGFSTMVKFFNARKQCRNHMRLMTMAVESPMDAANQQVAVPQGYSLPEMDEKSSSTPVDEIMN